MRAWSPLMVVCALLAPCDTNGQPGGPLETAVKFFQARQAFQCREVWDLYSAGTQEDIRAKVHRREREREGLPQAEKPEEQYCASPGKLKRGSARITRQQGSEALAAAEFTVKEVSDRNLFPRFPVKTFELRLIREGGAWRVELPRVPTRRSAEQLTEVGPVDVRHTAGGGGMHSTLEATAVVPARRASLETALSDPKLWARAFPLVDAVESLGREGELERVRLTFSGTDQPITIMVRPVSRSGDPTSPNTAVLWEVEGGLKARAYARGSWVIKPYPDGTRITLKLVFDPRPSPKGVGTEIFSPERASEAVLGLEKAALRTAPP
jgi:hypothetical protein